MTIPLRVLIIEDSEDDALLVLRELQRGGFKPDYRQIETAVALQAALAEQDWDLIVCDYALPHFNGLEALRLFRATGKDIPFLVVSGTIGEDIAVNTMLAGARDYIMKDRLSRLVPAVQRELQEAQERHARHAAEKALQVAQEYSAQIINNTPAIVCGTEPDGTIRFVNPAAEQITGYSAAEIIGKNLWDLLFPGDLYHQVERLLETLQRHDVQDHEMALLTQSGEKRTILWNSMNKYDDSGHLVQIIGFGVDITERKRSEAALQRYRDQLEELVRQRTAELNLANEHLIELSQIKDRFVSNVTHELRTPITNLKLHQYLMRVNAGKAEEHLAVIQRETDRLAHTIDALLNLSRLDQGRVPYRPRPVNLNSLAEQYVTDRRPLAEQNGLFLRFESSPISPIVLADESLLGQGLSILLTNALNYTPAGGQVTIRTEIFPSNGQIHGRLLVHDTGPGIAPEDRPRLFERFFRGKVGQESGMPGTGLGLALAQEIVQLQQGQIGVLDSDPLGQGATFVIALPLCSGRESPG